MEFHEDAVRMLPPTSAVADKRVESSTMRDKDTRGIIYFVDTATQRDAPALVNALPFELLSCIFRCTSPEKWRVEVAVTLAGVCRLWRDVIHNTVYFWTDVRVGRLDLAHLCLQRSRQAAIEFRLVQQYHQETASSSTEPVVRIHQPLPDESLDTLVKHIARIRALDVRVHTGMFPVVLPRLAPLRAPVLSRMDMYDTNDAAYSRATLASLLTSNALKDNPLFADAPLLHLSVHGLLPKSPITTHNSLKSLILDVGYAQELHPYIVLATMNASPQLESARVCLAAPLATPADILMTPLPSLRHLSLQVNDPADAVYFLRSIAAPRLAQVAVDVTSYSEDLAYDMVRPLLDAIVQLPEPLRSVLLHGEFGVSSELLRIVMTGHPGSSPDEAALSLQFLFCNFGAELVRLIVQKLRSEFPHALLVERQSVCTQESGVDVY